MNELHPPNTCRPSIRKTARPAEKPSRPTHPAAGVRLACWKDSSARVHRIILPLRILCCIRGRCPMAARRMNCGRLGLTNSLRKSARGRHHLAGEAYGVHPLGGVARGDQAGPGLRGHHPAIQNGTADTRHHESSGHRQDFRRGRPAAILSLPWSWCQAIRLQNRVMSIS
jgi:hypothetical protein